MSCLLFLINSLLHSFFYTLLSVWRRTSYNTQQPLSAENCVTLAGDCSSFVTVVRSHGSALDLDLWRFDFKMTYSRSLTHWRISPVVRHEACWRLHSASSSSHVIRYIKRRLRPRRIKRKRPRGHFEGKRVGTPFPLLERIMDGIANHVAAKNALYCGILHIQSQNISGSDTSGHLQKRSRYLDPDTNFRLACQRSHFSDFTKRPLNRPTW